MDNQNPQFKKVLLVILDGFGVASDSFANAITHAGMKNFGLFVNYYPSLTLQAAGPNVGLGWDDPGNSEVGHTCLGAGRIILQDMPRIDQSIADGIFYQNPAFLKAIEHVKKNQSALHLIGLIGDGLVHASQLHLYSLLTLASESGVDKVFIHAFTDGRDTAPNKALEDMKAIEKKILDVGIGKVATVIGRFYAMDRAEHWDLTESAYKAMVIGEGEIAEGPLSAIEQNYEKNIFDETIPPTVIEREGKDPVTIKSNDAVIMWNYRPDRAIQITKALVAPQSVPFANKYPPLSNLLFVAMTQYSQGLPVVTAFEKQPVPNTLAEILSKNGKKQYHISESEKYAHVTYFFNNGKQTPNAGEEWKILSSSSSYKERYQNVPQMSAPELTVALLEKLDEPIDVYVVNYANPDMVAHTGNFEASKKALLAIDDLLGDLANKALEKKDLLMLITSDHGNIEEVKTIETGRVSKAHTGNPVPFLAIGEGLKLSTPLKKGYLELAAQVPEGLLSDVAPTVLDVLNIEKPSEMTGVSMMAKFFKQIGNNDP
ncbi:MAG: 2,3-bisphosphoglycerate-independent phosphoglycerate mutase [Candidatus Doudnabacteria bacterium CG10_big_fil_rev_8_21_14_0_10_41_10]|uniref:2,3-bisphosphoglycerate-independent phosphoglycerate mutase n=1 Tax=Candidatus Doudnabacteria bacterium CG10_big_fil_rev_8_21_14_0_10_41_10 TaxID=1974551 RepID=A0A2H0VE51_9BACT|nr:MAG: 2,3-bisphosphoglycerate-independent phosphoglycerate mutase [Candidatus Doudnabacteria bacterium CG10_big_fil_rev_8_21_14_0_10_41_10]